jgi:aryl-alcohol dehydrogenase-like predicted oxidoreductase
MLYSPFGRTGIRVSQIALGTAGMLGTSSSGQIDRSQAESIMNAFLEAGGNFIDTPDAYLAGKSQEMLGRFLHGRREQVVLLTKYTRTSQPTATPASTGNHRKAMCAPRRECRMRPGYSQSCFASRRGVSTIPDGDAKDPPLLS